MATFTIPLNPWELYLMKLLALNMAQQRFVEGSLGFADSLTEAIDNINNFYETME